jgi:hypothetical protein
VAEFVQQGECGHEPGEPHPVLETVDEHDQHEEVEEAGTHVHRETQDPKGWGG